MAPRITPRSDISVVSIIVSRTPKSSNLPVSTLSTLAAFPTPTAYILAGGGGSGDVETLVFGLVGLFVAILGVTFAYLQLRKMHVFNNSRANTDITELGQSYAVASASLASIDRNLVSLENGSIDPRIPASKTQDSNLHETSTRHHTADSVISDNLQSCEIPSNTANYNSSKVDAAGDGISST